MHPLNPSFANERPRPPFLPMTDWSQCLAVESDPERLSGAWVFRGTRVPASALFENLDAGATVDEFLAWFPGVTKEQVDSLLQFTSASLASA